MNAIKIVNKIAKDKKLVFSFFAVFSRFEYALKRSGFASDSNGHTEADWTKYEKTLAGQFANINDADFQAAISFLKQQPPEKQILRKSGDLAFSPTKREQGVTDEQYVLVLVRRIRNNLFHGGKFPMRPVSDAARNRKLLNAGITVMKQCLALNKNVRDVFEEV